MSGVPRYRTLAPMLRQRFGRPVHRVALDAGSSCPNRDGTKGRGGCTYCDVEGSGTGALRSGVELAQQLEQGIARVRRRAQGAGVIAYFQSYSNTYVAPERLREVLRVVEPWIGDPVVAIGVATRPDTLPEWALAELSAWNARLPTWIELGLETADDEILRRIQRLHSAADFLDACARSRAAGLEVVAHAILGLPGDECSGARRTAELLAASGAEGVKVHQLMVLRRTVLEQQWRRGEVETLEEPTYVEWLADFVERLRPEQVLHRLTGDAPPSSLLAPPWSANKNRVRAALEAELERRGTRQGALWNGGRAARAVTTGPPGPTGPTGPAAPDPLRP